MRRNRYFTLLLLVGALFSAVSAYGAGESTKQERNAITEGNKLYGEGRYRAAMQKYQQALQENGNSAVARYNLGLSQIRIGSNPSDTTQAAKDMVAKGCQAMEQVAKMGATNPGLAAKANYNLGNVSFNSEDYRNALNYYKQALRLNPDDNAARRNLRITQLKLDNQDDNQDQNQDQNQNQQQNQDQQNQDQQQDKKDPQQQQQDINQQTADQILQAMENKENQTRARVATGNPGDKSNGRRKNPKNW